MARKEQVTCDVCGEQKQETNNWFVISLSGNRLSIMARDLIGETQSYDCCGEACVLRKVSELLVKCH